MPVVRSLAQPVVRPLVRLSPDPAPAYLPAMLPVSLPLSLRPLICLTSREMSTRNQNQSSQLSPSLFDESPTTLCIATHPAHNHAKPTNRRNIRLNNFTTTRFE